MNYLIYNPLSKGGASKNAIARILKKNKIDKVDYKIESILDLNDDLKNFVSSLNYKDKIIIVGGDGTLHHLVNKIDIAKIDAQVFFAKGGSGNDFAREYKKSLIDLKKELSVLPTYDDGVNGPTKFINGVGIGMDAEVCYQVNICNKAESYLKTTIRSIKEYKTYKLKITVDGREMEFDDVYFFACMNGKYIGGGMKIAPHAKRHDEYLELYVITSKTIGGLLRIFPSVFLGWHGIFKKKIHYFRCQHVIASLNEERKLQSDGEVSQHIDKIEVKFNNF